jgi:hypothetical protein
MNACKRVQLAVSWALAGAHCCAGYSALAQVSAPTQQDLDTAPVQFRAEVTGNPAASGIELRDAPKGALPITGPRDFTGVYTGAAKTSAASASTARTVPPVAGDLSSGANRGCLPAFRTGIGGAYPTHVVSGRDLVVIVQEENHQVRRVYLGSRHPTSLRPSIMGHSVGYFEGDTLVVETIGLKSGETVVERIRKVDGGRRIETTVNDRAMLANWRPDLYWVENICEDSGDLFGPAYTTKEWSR